MRRSRLTQMGTVNPICQYQDPFLTRFRLSKVSRGIELKAESGGKTPGCVSPAN